MYMLVVVLLVHNNYNKFSIICSFSCRRHRCCCSFCVKIHSHEMLLEYMTMLFIFGLTTHIERTRYLVQGR